MLIVGIGGTTRPGSTSETALRAALAVAEREGLETRCFGGADLQLPLYDPSVPDRTPEAKALIDALTGASGVILSSPGYHGTLSGLVKNSLDYIEDLVDADPPYLTDLPVGCIAVAYGSQAAVNTLRALRDVAHALRGWPTPYGAAINATDGGIRSGAVVDAGLLECLERVGEQVVGQAKLTAR